MNCSRCGSERILEIDGKSSDRNIIEFQGKTYVNMYVPSNCGIGNNSDCIMFSYCLDCGQMQGDFPVDGPDFIDDENEE